MAFYPSQLPRIISHKKRLGLIHGTVFYRVLKQPFCNVLILFILLLLLLSFLSLLSLFLSFSSFSGPLFGVDAGFHSSTLERRPQVQSHPQALGPPAQQEVDNDMVEILI